MKVLNIFSFFFSVGLAKGVLSIPIYLTTQIEVIGCYCVSTTVVVKEC